MIKELPEPVKITKSGTSQVIGWTGQASFIVKDIKPVVREGSDLVTPQILDGEEEASYLSLWDWAKRNKLSVEQFDDLQKRLETYIDPSVPEDVALHAGRDWQTIKP